MTQRTHRVFLDSDVILSGIFSEHGAPRIIIDLLRLKLPFFSAVTGRLNILEIERGLSRKFSGAMPVYNKFLQEFDLKVFPLPTKAEIEKFSSLSARSNSPIYITALLCHADFLVTGNVNSFAAEHPSSNLKVLAPEDFLKTVISGITAR